MMKERRIGDILQLDVKSELSPKFYPHCACRGLVLKVAICDVSGIWRALAGSRTTGFIADAFPLARAKDASRTHYSAFFLADTAPNPVEKDFTRLTMRVFRVPT